MIINIKHWIPKSFSDLVSAEVDRTEKIFVVHSRCLSFVKSLQRLIINRPSLQNPQNHSARYNLGRRIPFAFPIFFSSINRPNLQNPQNHSARYYFGRRLASQPQKPQCTLFMAQATSFLVETNTKSYKNRSFIWTNL